jgi:hypothetical protein
VFLSELGFLISRWFRQTQRLFHLLVGLLFLGLAAAGGTVTAAEWKFYREAPSTGPARFAMLAGFTAFLIVLGLYSFLKARSVR